MTHDPDPVAPETMASRPGADRRQPVDAAALAWLAAFIVLLGYTVWRIDLFPLSTTVMVDGTAVPVPRTFFTVDHPFHIARAALVRDAWASFDTVRWIANHQGGYPAEFYPLGVSALAAALSLLSFGGFDTGAAYAIVIVVIFLLPGLAFLLLARRDRLGPAVPLIALAAQIAIASDWTHGGYTGLVEWGLATNVAGFTFALLAIPLLVRATGMPGWRAVALAAAVIALCAVSNPRALLAIAAIAVAILVQGLIDGHWRKVPGRVAIIAALAAGLAAPVLFPLLRYRDLYFFLEYQTYSSVGDYLQTSLDVLTWPVAVLTLIGFVFALLTPAHRAARVCAMTMALYIAGTALAVSSAWVQGLIPQLELPRLMPFQRLLMIYLAAYGAVGLVQWLLRVPRQYRMLRDALFAGAVTVALMVVFTTGAGPFIPAERGLRDVPRTDGPDAAELVQFRRAIALADAATPDATAILVLGSRLSWHEQLWAPTTAEDRRFYYNDWLWYWHHLHAGPYDFHNGHFYPDPGEAISPDYFRVHGIGAVVVTDIANQSDGMNAKVVAASSPALEPAGTRGAWAVFTVRDPVSIATLNGSNAGAVAIDDDNETLRLTFKDVEAGTVRVRENWFPRWQATVNGASVPVSRAADGYMTVPVPAGDPEITLSYATTALDIVARVLAVVSGVIVVLLALFGSRAVPLRSV